jgi:hypothetical protein
MEWMGVSDKDETLIEKIKNKLKGPDEPPYVHTLVTDGRKYIDSNEFIKQPHVKKQMKQMSEQIKKRKGRLDA